MEAGVFILTPGKHFTYPPSYKSHSLHWGNVKKNTDFVDKMVCKVLHGLPFSLNQPLKSDDDWYIRTFRYVIETYKYVDMFFQC
jgi:hypothetical protein